MNCSLAAHPHALMLCWRSHCPGMFAWATDRGPSSAFFQAPDAECQLSMLRNVMMDTWATCAWNVGLVFILVGSFANNARKSHHFQCSKIFEKVQL